MSKWEMVKLGDIFKITSGGTPLKSKPEYYENGIIPWVRTGDLKEKYILKVEGVITEEGLKNSSAKIFPINTVLVAMYGATIGACSILAIKASTNQACAAFFPNDKVDSSYLYYFLNSKRNDFIKMGVGGAQPNISAAILKAVELPLPPLETQKQIAKTLETASELLSMRKQQLAELDGLIKSVFYDMFGDPVTNEKGWIQKFLYELLDEIKYGTSTPPIFSDYGYCFIRATNIKFGRIIEEDMKSISENEAKKISKCKLKAGDIIIVRSGVNTGDTCVIDGKFIGQYAGYDLILTLNSKLLNPIYFNELINTKFLELVVKPLTRRAAQPHLNAEQTKNLSIILPPLTLQTQFASIVTKIEEQKALVKKVIDETQYLLDSLMSQYFD
ncbi:MULTISPECIES: restriction endonuclease subunit S [unclassified Dehalobacter]|uniref:restriction endonuclease subunit S n=1 Tax=unclassified Dehalobacter TaxID=2635733 RepID=UPI000E6C479B|nr:MULTISPECIES: restriction endonuclease subunit S [unclassified Dehalobacter]RJE47200.1 hypothetical protein A7K50_04310 [Dehalobacter sp. MCB1]TCX53554.1 type I restriction endonuclease subunit R [Dehalobacter sp. 14DCB1]TCX54939.1 type I restriction endonuclease subunit R [Dehalobacter sp. 12DCB1]